jgi:ABC-2 type transport system ATP-binding protein
MDEVEHLADRVAVLRNGRVVEESTPRQLGGRETARALISFAIDVPGSAADTTLPSGPWTLVERKSVETGRDEFVLATDDVPRALHVLTSWSLDDGEELVALAVTRPTLEEAYLQLTEYAPSAATS